MVSYIYIDNERIKISSTVKVVKAKDYSEIVKIDGILSKACDQAARIISEAQKTANKMIIATEIACASEKEKGYLEGLKAAKNEMAMQISAVSIKSSQYIQGIEQTISALVLDSLGKVIDSLDKSELINGLIKKALAVMQNQTQIALKVAPAHVDFLNHRISEIMKDYPKIQGIEIKGDGRLKQDQLILESAIGIVDASIEVQLSAIEEAFSQCFKA